MTTIDETGEAWLRRAEHALRPMFTRAGLIVPDNIRYAIAFPSAGSRSSTIGECWYAAASSDNRHTIIVRTDQTEPVDVLAILIHELLHASLPPGTGHGPVFRKHMDKLMLTGPATATTLTFAGRLAMAELITFGYSGIGSLTALGTVPWGQLRWGGATFGPGGPGGEYGPADRPKPQGTRMLKADCSCCGYTIRITKKWADKGLPACPQDGNGLTLECD